ncbi:carboxypeptidase Y-deficient [Gamsiella multidivaricata]|nr:carboxypeptidase Y-deficient [Gamsiella multidivaricata]
MATNAASTSQLHARLASSPQQSQLKQQQQQQQQPQRPQQPQRSVTISRRKFGPSPGTRPQSTLSAPQPSNERGPVPPPKSPQSRPISTVNTNGNGASPNGTPPPSVACPICNISLRNLAQLNQHLDTIHPEEPDDVKSAVSQFFRNAQKVLNPITRSATTTFKNIPANSSELLRKIQDLDLDSAGPGNSLSGPPPPGGVQGWTDPRADAVVTKRHWVRESDQDECFHPNCDKGLGIRYGRQHCRSCGNMFCEAHSSFQIKLNAQAMHDVDGLWCRVCEGCFIRAKKEDDGYHAGGVSRNLTTDFLSTRIKSAEKKHLEVNRLEKRIEKLAQIHQQYDSGASFSSIPSSPSPSLSSASSGTGSIRAKGLFRSVTSRGQQLKVSEQAIVKWEDDSTVPACYICLSMFNRYGNRKHHCRLCGHVICDNCSKVTPLYLNVSNYPDGSNPVGHTRACKECIHAVFKRKEHAADKKRPNAVLKYYGSMMRLKARIDLALPRFQEMIATLGQKADMNHTHPDYQLAARSRKELLDDFALFDSISKKIMKLPAHSQHQKQLHTNLYWWATQYLQTNMFPLSVIPKMFGKDPKQVGASSPSPSSPAPSISSSMPDSAQDNEAAIESLAQLAVMEEQRRLVESYIKEASRKRKFDDVKSLKMSLEDLENEIAAIRSTTGGGIMSTASDGRRPSRADDPALFRKNLQPASLDYVKTRTPDPISEEQRKRGMEEHQRFMGLIRFLESSLDFPDLTGKGRTIENRLAIIIQSMVAKEKRSADLEQTNTLLNQEIDNLKSGNIVLATNRSQEPLEATLTRIMKQHEVTLGKLQGDLEATRTQLSEKEKQVAQLTEDRAVAEANLKEARTREEDLSKALSRSEKGRTSMAQSRDAKADECNKLKTSNKNYEAELKLKESLISDLRRDNDHLKRSYDKAKTRSLVQDVERIKSLTDQLRATESRLTKIVKENVEKNESFTILRTRLQKLQEEKNNELTQLGQLQEELAAKDLELSNVRSASAGYESAAKIAERERDAAIQRATHEADDGRQKLEVAYAIVRERESEREFLKASINAMEEKAAQQSARIREESNLSREKDDQLAMLKSNIRALEEEVDALKQNQSPQPVFKEEEQQVRVKSEPDVAMNEQEIRLELNHALARLWSLEELIAELEEETTRAKAIQEEIAARDEELRQTIQTQHRDILWKEEKLSRLERDIERRKQDLMEKVGELVDSKSRLQEHELKAQVLEEECKGLRHQVAMFERVKAEQQEQLDGRERALKRLEEARKNYDKVYENKIERLQEEKTSDEKRMLAELAKLNEKHEEEQQDYVQQSAEAIEEAERAHEQKYEELNSELAQVRTDRDELRRKVDEKQEALDRSIKEIEERNTLLSGYMALVSQQEADGMLQEGSGAYNVILQQQHDKMQDNQRLRAEVEGLKRAMEDQINILQQYIENNMVLTDRNESYVRHFHDREVEIVNERNARHKELTSLKQKLATKEKEAEVLEQELREKEDLWKRKEAAYMKGMHAQAAPAAPAPTSDPALPVDSEPATSSALLMDTEPATNSALPMDTEPATDSALPMDTEPATDSALPMDTEPTSSSASSL